MNDQIKDTCRQIADWMHASWQRLPSLLDFREPLPLEVTLRHFERNKVATSASYKTSFDAIVQGLEHECDGPLVVVSGPGGGKSSALRWATGEFARLALAGSQSDYLPVYVDLGHVGTQLPDTSLLDIIGKLRKTARPLNYAAFILADRPLVFILDGLDLLPASFPAGKLLDQIYNRHGSFEDRFVVATRPLRQILAVLDDWHASVRIQLGPLDERACRRWLVASSARVSLRRFNALARDNRGLASLLLNPMLFALAATVAADDTCESPVRCDQFPGLTGILNGFIKYLSSRAVREGRFPESVAFEGITRTLGRICLAHARNDCLDRIIDFQVHATPDDYVLPDDTVSRKDFDQLWNNARAAALAMGLMRSDPQTGEFIFLHQQFSEFLAGQYLANRIAFAARHGFFEAELFDCLASRRMDGIVRHALGVLSTVPATKELVARAFQFMARCDEGDACNLIAPVGGEVVGTLLTRLLPVDGQEPTLHLIEALRDAGSASCISALERICVAHPVSMANKRAMQALTSIAPLQAKQFLRQRILDQAQHTLTRTEAFDILAKLSMEDSTEVFRAVLTNEREDDAFVSHLVGAMLEKDAVTSVRLLASSQYFCPEKIGFARCYHAIAAAMKYHIEDLAVDDAIRRVGDSPTLTAENQLRLAGQIKNAKPNWAVQIVTPLCRNHDTPAAVRIGAAGLLAHLQVELEYVRQLLRDLAEDRTLSEYDRFSASYALVRIDPPTGIALCEAYFRDSRIAIQARALDAVAFYFAEPQRGIPELILAYVRDISQNASDRLNVIKNVAYGDSSLGEKLLQERITDPEEETDTRRGALRILKEIAPQSAQALSEVICRDRGEPSELRTAALWFLLISRRSREIIKSVYCSVYPDPWIKSWPASFLAEVDPVAAFPALIDNLRSEGSNDDLALGRLVQSGTYSWQDVESRLREAGASYRAIRSVAYSAGRRALPVTVEAEMQPLRKRRALVLGSPTAFDAGTEQRVERVSLAPDAGASRKNMREVAVDAEQALAAYLTHCHQEGLTPSLRGAEQWTRAKRMGWSKSKFQKTRTWRAYLKTTGSRDELRSEQRRKSESLRRSTEP